MPARSRDTADWSTKTGYRASPFAFPKAPFRSRAGVRYCAGGISRRIARLSGNKCSRLARDPTDALPARFRLDRRYRDRRGRLTFAAPDRGPSPPSQPSKQRRGGSSHGLLRNRPDGRRASPLNPRAAPSAAFRCPEPWCRRAVAPERHGERCASPPRGAKAAVPAMQRAARRSPEQGHTALDAVTESASLWGRLATCGGLVTRLPTLAKLPVQRRFPTGVQDDILPHRIPEGHCILQASIAPTHAVRKAVEPSLRPVQSFVGFLDPAGLQVVARIVERRFNARPQRDQLRMKRHAFLLQAVLNRFGGAKIAECPRGDQLHSLPRLAGGFLLGASGILSNRRCQDEKNKSRMS